MLKCYRRSTRSVVPICSEDGAHVLKGEDLYAVEGEAAAILNRLPSNSVLLRCQLSLQRFPRRDVDSALDDLLRAGIIETASLLQWARSQAERLKGRFRSRSLHTAYKRCAIGLFALRCYYLRWRLRRSEPEAASSKGGRPRGVLVIIYGGIGDMVLATPLLRRLHEARPTTPIDVLVRAKNAALYRRCPFVSKIIPFCGFRTMFRCWGGPSDPARALYRSRYGVVISLMEHFGGTRRWLNGKAIAYITGAETRVGMWDHVCQSVAALAKPLLTHPVPFHREHEVARGARLVRELGIDGPPGPLEAWYGPQERQQADRIIARCRASRAGSTTVGIAPFTARDKMWPLDYWAELLTRLAGDFDSVGIVFGGPADLRAAAVLNALCQERLANLTGQTPLPLFCALVSRLDLLLSVDTGAAHIAAAHRIPQVVLFGPVNPRKYGPWKNPHARVLRAPGGAMKNLTVEDVCCTIHSLRVEQRAVSGAG